jgi:hypothetical protein
MVAMARRTTTAAGLRYKRRRMIPVVPARAGAGLPVGGGTWNQNGVQAPDGVR